MLSAMLFLLVVKFWNVWITCVNKHLIDTITCIYLNQCILHYFALHSFLSYELMIPTFASIQVPPPSPPPMSPSFPAPAFSPTSASQPSSSTRVGTIILVLGCSRAGSRVSTGLARQLGKRVEEMLILYIVGYLWTEMIIFCCIQTLGDNRDGYTSTGSVALQLRTGDRVQVGHCRYAASIYNSEMTNFSGMLVRPDV